MNSRPSLSELKQTHASILELQTEMERDQRFRTLCERHELPWNPAAGYRPQWYNGPAPKNARVLFVMAEPGAITETQNLEWLRAVDHEDWFGNGKYNLALLEHYWRDNLRDLCRYIWPEDTEAKMYTHLGGTCAFWMSLPRGRQTAKIPPEVLNYFLNTYLRRLLALFPNALILAAGGKAQARLRRVGATFETCSAFTKPESNKPRARDSWRKVGLAIAEKLKAGRQSGTGATAAACVPDAQTSTTGNVKLNPHGEKPENNSPMRKPTIPTSSYSRGEASSPQARSTGGDRAMTGISKERTGQRQRFWGRFAEFRRGLNYRYHFGKPRNENWCNVTDIFGRNDAIISLQITPAKREMSCSLYIGNNKSLYYSLIERRSEIDLALSIKVEWYVSDEARKVSYVKTTRDFDIEDVERWQDGYGWLLEKVDLFIKAFAPYLRG